MTFSRGGKFSLPLLVVVIVILHYRHASAETCMHRWLRLAGDDTDAVINSQRLSSVLFDEEDHSNARIQPILPLLLTGGQTLATSLLKCLKKEEGPCLQQAACTTRGVCKISPTTSNYYCKCPAGLHGDFCQEDKDECQLQQDNCHGNATCINIHGSFKCTCIAGHQGDGTLCADIDECASLPCQNGGTCENLNNHFRCVCARGLLGETCQEDFNECASNPCQHGGKCYDKRDGFVCVCHIRYDGKRCQHSWLHRKFFYEMEKRLIANMKDEIIKVEERITNPKSCKEIKDKVPSSSSGDYYVQQSYDRPLQKVYCEMERDGGGWARIAVINASSGCPASMRRRHLTKNICTRPQTNSGTCVGATYSVPYPYKEVLGYVTGYTDKTNDAFTVASAGDPSIDGTYVDGVSITAGTPRHHIWTYAASNAHSGLVNSCPCMDSGGRLPPSFVGRYFYCSTSTTSSAPYEFNEDGHAWSSTDSCPLRQGCCNTGQPWFHRIFGESSSYSLEIRICNDQHPNDEDIGVDDAELFVR